MITITKGSRTQLQRFTPESMALNLSERQSTATLTIGPDAPDMAAMAWLMDETEPGAGIFWRVKSVDDQVEKETRTVQLEHMIQSLKDTVIFGEVKPQDMGGTSAGCTVRQAAAYVLGKQSVWTLYECDYSGSYPYTFNGDDLYAAMEKITSALEDACWVYDFSVYPFRFSIKQKPNTGVSEMRMSRNIRTLKRTIDKSRMYTRIFPIGKKNLHITGDFIAMNVDTYGAIDKVETDQSQDTEAKLRAWALSRLKNHCEPSVTVTISGLDLSRASGEPLDRFEINHPCRVPLPEYGTYITERVTKASWPDKIKEKEVVTLTLANLQEDVASIINEMKSSGGGGGRAAAKEAEEDHAWLVDTTDKAGMVAVAVAGKTSTGEPNWSRVASFYAEHNLADDTASIQGRVTTVEGEVATHEAHFEMTDRSITQEVTNRVNACNALSGRIDVEAGKVSLIVDENGIKKGAIYLALNGAGGSDAHLDADNVYIGNQKSTTVINGKVTMDQVTAKIGEYDFLTTTSLRSKAIAVQSLNATGGIAAGGSLTAASMECNGLLQADTMKLGGHSVLSSGILYGQPTKTEADGQITLTFPTSSGGSYAVTFSRAAATTLSGAWSNGKLTVTASPQGSKYETQTSMNLDGNGSTNFSAQMKTDGTVRNSVYAYLVKSGTKSSTVVNACSSSSGTEIVGSIAVGSLYTEGFTDGRSDGWGGCYSGVELSEASDKTLSYGQTLTIYAKAYQTPNATAKSNADSVKITAPADRYQDGRSNGWSGCYGGIELSEASDKTLNYGQTLTIYAKAYQTPNATAKSNADSVKITAPADRYQDGYDAGYAAGKAAMGLSRSGNTITLSEGSTTKRIVASYTASSHTAGTISWSGRTQSAGPGVLKSGNMIYYSTSSTYRNYTASISGDDYSPSSLSWNSYTS